MVINSEIDKILNFFEQNYIVGKDEIKSEDIKEFNIKELSKFKKEENIPKETKDNKSDKENNKEEKKDNKNNDKEEKNEKKEDKKNKINYIDIIILEERIICAFTEDGHIHIFDIDDKTFVGKYILSQKVHDEKIVAVDNIKKTKNKFVTCDEKNIKIWRLINKNNIYSISCEAELKEISKSPINILHALNNSNILFIDEENVKIIDSSYKEIFKLSVENSIIKGLYQIESNDENNNLIFLGQRKTISLINLSQDNTKYKFEGIIRCGCFSSKSFYYLGNNKLLVGDNDIYIADIKTLNLENIINIGRAEISCFLKFKDMIVCCYGDTRHYHYGVQVLHKKRLQNFVF